MDSRTCNRVSTENDVMGQIVVDVADYKVSSNPNDFIITYALGSCIAIVVYDPIVKVGGMLHYMLPDSSIDKERVRQTPAKFADTGIPVLFRACYELGAAKKRMTVVMVGGASILTDAQNFRIGHRNIIAARRIFWRNNIFISNEDVGGKVSRSVRLEMATGKTEIWNAGGYKVKHSYR